MGKSNWKRVPSKQICIHKGKKSLLEIVNCMQPPSLWFPWHLHAEGEEGEGKPSLLRLVMVDYSDRKDTKSVYAHLKPKEVKWLYHQIYMMIQEVSFSQQKIFRQDKSINEGMVTRLWITRRETDGQGKKRELPWYVEIGNGTGIAERNSAGGEFCKKGTYHEKKKVFINLSDADAFMLFEEAVTVIYQCEREHLFHRRDVDNLKALVKQIGALIEKMDEKENSNAA